VTFVYYTRRATAKTTSPKRTRVTLFTRRQRRCSTHIYLYAVTICTKLVVQHTHAKKPLEVFHPWFGNSSRNNRKVLRSLCMRLQHQSGAPLGPLPHKRTRTDREGEKMDETEMKKMDESYYDIIRFPVRPYMLLRIYYNTSSRRRWTGGRARVKIEREWKNFYTLTTSLSPLPIDHSPQIT